MHVWIPGRPVQQGSVTRNRAGGIYSDNSKPLGEWRARVTLAAAAVLGDEHEPTRHAVAIRARFVFTRPAGHVLKSGGLSKSARRHPSGRPDLDKLVRSVLDALTGVVYVDDSQVVVLSVQKEYGNADGLDLYADVLA